MRRILLGVLLVGLAGLLVYQWRGWSQAAAVATQLQLAAAEGPVEAAPPVTSPLPSVVVPGPLDDFVEVIERPLFNRDRQPRAEAETAAVEIASDRPQLQLLGIVGSEGVYQVLIQPAQGEGLKLSMGDTHEGWEVAEILPDRLVLTREDRRVEFELRPAPTTAPAEPAADRRTARDYSSPGVSGSMRRRRAPPQGDEEQ